MQYIICTTSFCGNPREIMYNMYHYIYVHIIHVGPWRSSCVWEGTQENSPQYIIYILSEQYICYVQYVRLYAFIGALSVVHIVHDNYACRICTIICTYAYASRNPKKNYIQYVPLHSTYYVCWASREPERIVLST